MKAAFWTFKGVLVCLGVAVWLGLVVPVLIEYMPLPFTILTSVGVPAVFLAAIISPYRSVIFSRWRNAEHETRASAESSEEIPPQDYGQRSVHPDTHIQSEKAADVRVTEPLSKRESEVLRLMSAGRTNKEIARALFVEIGTVKTHTNSINRKLGSHHRAEAIAKARDLGLL